MNKPNRTIVQLTHLYLLFWIYKLGSIPNYITILNSHADVSLYIVLNMWTVIVIIYPLGICLSKLHDSWLCNRRRLVTYRVGFQELQHITSRHIWEINLFVWSALTYSEKVLLGFLTSCRRYSQERQRYFHANQKGC